MAAWAADALHTQVLGDSIVIRRTTMVAAAGLALILAPTAAMAYQAPGFSTTTTDATPTIGEPITITSTGAATGAALTLTVTSNPASISNDSIQIAGTKSSTKVATSAGVTWSVTLSAAGTYTAAVTNAQGQLVGDQVLTVVAAAAPAAAAPALSATGFGGTELAFGAGALVLAGAGAVLIARRRSAAAH